MSPTPDQLAELVVQAIACKAPARDLCFALATASETLSQRCRELSRKLLNNLSDTTIALELAEEVLDRTKT